MDDERDELNLIANVGACNAEILPPKGNDGGEDVVVVVIVVVVVVVNAQAYEPRLLVLHAWMAIVATNTINAMLMLLLLLLLL